MKDEKILNISDSEIEKISGGSNPGPVCSNKSWYRSGDTPKYKKGDIVTLTFCLTIGAIEKEMSTTCKGRILDVSSDKCCGSYCKEFGYKIQILSVDTFDRSMNNAYKDRIYENVYESCLS